MTNYTNLSESHKRILKKEGEAALLKTLMREQLFPALGSYSRIKEYIDDNVPDDANDTLEKMLKILKGSLDSLVELCEQDG